MIEKLPYQLTDGVTATREGLEFSGDAVYSILYCSGMVPFDQLDPDTHKPIADDECDEYDKDPIDRVSWSCVAERLSYRGGEPWCVEGRYNGLACGNDHWDELPLEARPLHRLSAIICDDAEAFRVLHWCVENLTEPLSTTGGAG